MNERWDTPRRDEIVGPDARTSGSVVAPLGEAAVHLADAGLADRFEVRVPTPEDGEIVVDVRRRRADVVHRLLGLGVSRRTLVALLPEWSELIGRVASEYPASH